MDDKNVMDRHELFGLQFLGALRRGEAARLADLWHRAETDPALEALFEDLLAGEADAVEAGPSQPDQVADITTRSDLTIRPPLRRRPAMPPMPIVVVRHRLDNCTSDHDAHPERREEPRSDVGSFKESR
jgi:hypothetical protein